MSKRILFVGARRSIRSLMAVAVELLLPSVRKAIPLRK